MTLPPPLRNPELWLAPAGLVGVAVLLWVGPGFLQRYIWAGAVVYFVALLAWFIVMGGPRPTRSASGATR
ncbi:MAG TPA: hypothetical protein VGV89_02920 [Thermoplasmata archaeon]|nr:hypothetical protein [Thermoplasmata archaeon]